jgi:hypothetical protein
MSDQFLEQRINIKFCVKLGKKNQELLSGINDSKRAGMSKLQMKTTLITYFDIKSIVHFEFIPQGHTINEVYCVEILKRLREAVRMKRAELGPNQRLDSLL